MLSVNFHAIFVRLFLQTTHIVASTTTQADIEEMEELSGEEEMDDDVSQVSQLDLFPDLNDDDPNEQENVAEEPMVILSQETLSSQYVL